MILMKLLTEAYKYKSVKDTEYGDLSGKIFNGDLNLKGLDLTVLDGSPKEVKGIFSCGYNFLESFWGAPKKVKTFIFDTFDNYWTETVFSEEIINHNIKANLYIFNGERYKLKDLQKIIKK